MIEWIKKNRVEFLILIALITVTAFLRLYRIDEYMTFLGDEGRDALVIKKILVERDLPLIGPSTSIGNMYLGPLYYYMMAIPMAISWLNPVAAAAMVALIGTATVGLIYYLARVWFGRVAAFVAALLYAISPVAIYYSRSSWNPNPTPFFVLLAIVGLMKIHKTGDFRWLILTAISSAFLIQMHYLALIFLPLVALMWLYEIILDKRKKLKRKNIVFGSLVSLICFLFLMSPLVIFDFRHDFMNYKALTTFFSQRETTVNLNPFNTIFRIFPIYTHSLVERFMAQGQQLLAYLLSAIILIPIFVAIINKLRGKSLKWSHLFLALWLFSGVGGLALYKQNIYDHYVGFVSPVIYLLLAAFIALFKGKYQYLLAGIIILGLGYINILKNPLLLEPNRQLYRTQNVANFIIAETGNKPFNFALIANSNYDAAYQFYLDLYGHKPKVVPAEKTDRLFVVCEDAECNPVGHRKYEIAAFGWTKIEREWEVEGVKIYKLVPNPDEKNNQ